MKFASRRQCYLVFGLKRGRNALGIVDEGEHDAYINLSLSGFMASVNRIATIFRYRRDFVYTTSDYQEIEVMDKKNCADRQGVQQVLVDEDAITAVWLMPTGSI